MSRPVSIDLAPEGIEGTDVVVVGCLAGEAPPERGLAPGLAAPLRVLASLSGWRAATEQELGALVTEHGTPVRLLLMGLGSPRQLDALTAAEWIGQAVEKARLSGARELTLVLPDHAEFRGVGGLERTARNSLAAAYRFDRYLNRPEEKECRLERIFIALPDRSVPGFDDALERARSTWEAVRLARDLGNAPGNEASPAWLEERAMELAEDHGLQPLVLHADRLLARGMGGLLAVGSGSTRPPRLIRLCCGSDGPRVALVGKGVTFDSGGLSLKTASSMEEMKFDKCGACNVLALTVAVAREGLRIRLRAYLPLVENMPSGGACRPGDIITCANGKTVEIVNTDAEGRLILADALSMASEDGADHLLEMSTLTGHAAVALGLQAAGLFTPDDGLASELLTAAERSGERLWRMPMWPEFAEQMKGTHSDLRNWGERWGGACTAAAFLSHFVTGIERWAHLDIAGPANAGKDALGGAGATGYGVALGLDWLRELAAR